MFYEIVVEDYEIVVEDYLGVSSTLVNLVEDPEFIREEYYIHW